MKPKVLRKKQIPRSVLVACILLLPVMALATRSVTETATETFSVKLGASRVIYNPDSSGETITVTNSQGYPVLIQSKVLEPDLKTPAPFVVTPPLMRLDSQQSSRLRIVRTGGDFAPDRESMQMLCVKGIPPKEGDAWANTGKDSTGKISLNIQLSINNCIKLLIRPASVKGYPDDSGNRLKWQRHDNKLRAVNDSPFYMNISALKINGKDVYDIKYIEPFSSHDFICPGGNNAGKVEWKLVNDFGGETSFHQDDVR